MSTVSNAGTLEIRGVRKEYRKADGSPLSVLEPVDLTIPGSEFVVLLGTSGCGKSTLLKLLAGLEEPTAGTLTLDGEPLGGPDRRRGLVFQDPNLFPWLTVRQNIAFGPKMRGREKAEAQAVEALIKLVGLDGFAEALPFELSGGMAQRAALARTLVNEPRVLLLDEPLGALDNFTRMAMQDEILKAWEARKTTAVMVTHDVDEALYMGDRIVVLSSRPGRLQEVLEVNLPRPRERNSPEFTALRSRILEIFHFAHHRDENQDFIV